LWALEKGVGQMIEVDIKKENYAECLVEAASAIVQKSAKRSLVDGIFSLCGSLGSAMFVGVGFIVVFEIMMRFIFRSPTTWTGEISGTLTIVAAFLLFSYTLREKGHTKVDFITVHLSKRSVLILEIFTSLLGIIYCGVLVGYGIKMLRSSYIMGELSQILQIPLWIPQMSVPLGGALMVIQLVRFLKDDLLFKLRSSEYSVSGTSSNLKAFLITIVFISSLIMSFILFNVSRNLGLALLFFALLFNGMPVAFAMGLFGLFSLYFLLGGTHALIHVPMTAYATVDSIVIVAFPLFILCGAILEAGQVGPRIFDFAYTLVRHFPGGLGIASVIFCGLFAAMTGSSVAVAASVSVIAFPEMLKRGYSREVTIGLLAAGGTLGILFPPSIALIYYSAVTFESLSALFLAGVIPGIIMCVFFIVYMVIVGLKDKNIQVDRRASLKEVGQAIRRSFGGLMVIIIIMGGIYSGLFTPTEAGAVAAVYSIFLCVVLYRTLSWKKLMESIIKAGKVSSMIILIIIGANIAGNFITMSQITQDIIKYINALQAPNWLYILMINILLIIMGGPLEAVSIEVITLPILFPVIRALGFNPLWFAVILVVNMELALISPPEGINLFILQEVSKSTTQEVWKGVMPFLVIIGLFLVLMSAFPILTTWLPSIVE
jgi:C4-dicarboxylate transporter DctM subunit